MSLSDQMRAAAAQAQSILAEIGGADSGANNALYNGANYVAVYGQPQVQRTMLAGGGFRQRTMVTATATRDQFATAPVANKQWIRTDLTPNLTYMIEKVEMHDAYLYTLTMFRPGE